MVRKTKKDSEESKIKVEDIKRKLEELDKSKTESEEINKSEKETEESEELREIDEIQESEESGGFLEETSEGFTVFRPRRNFDRVNPSLETSEEAQRSENLEEAIGDVPATNPSNANQNPEQQTIYNQPDYLGARAEYDSANYFVHQRDDIERLRGVDTGGTLLPQAREIGDLGNWQRRMTDMGAREQGEHYAATAIGIEKDQDKNLPIHQRRRPFR